MSDAHSERQHYNITLAALVFAGVAYALQQTLVIPALPALQRDLGTSTTWVTWTLTGFLLVASVATPLLGKLGDQYGKERLLLIALAIFFVGCVGAVVAPNIWVLIVFRAIQGTGGAVFPLSFAIIKDEFPEEKVGTAIGIVSAVFAVGGGLGLVLSGLIIDNLSWRWLFGVGAVAVALATVLVYRFVPESPIKTPSRVDYKGATLLSGGLIALLVALSEGENWGWTSTPTITLLTLAAVFLAVWGWAETRVPEPMVDMRMLARRPVLVANLTGLIAGFAMFGSFVLIPNFVQAPGRLPAQLADLVHYGFGASATLTGLYLLPGALTGFFTGPLAGPLGKRYGSQVPMSLGMLLVTVGIGILALFHEQPWQIVLGMIILGSGLPLTFAAMAKVIIDTVKQSETGVATGMNTVMRTIGGVIGGQIGAAILTADTIGNTSIPAESAFATAFWMSATAALIAAVIALFVYPRGRHLHSEPAPTPARAVD